MLPQSGAQDNLRALVGATGAHMRHQRFIDVSQSGDVATFERRLVEFANELDFGLVGAMLVVDRPGQKPSFFTLGNTPEGYSEIFQDAESARRDPVMQKLKQATVPFTYDQSFYVSKGAGDVWEQQATFGYCTGIAVALHLPGHRHFLLGVDRQKKLPKSDDRLTRLLADLQLLAVHAQDAAVRLMVHGGAVDDGSDLTQRELEVLRWTMAGKSAWEVGQILRISEGTVHFHARSTIRKLNVTDKHQAVLKALSLGRL